MPQRIVTRLIYLSLLALTPFLLGAVCSVRPPAASESRRIVVHGLRDDIVDDYLAVVPFVTLTPTPTLTPTVVGGAGAAGQPGGGQLPPGDATGPVSPGGTSPGQNPPVAGSTSTSVPTAPPSATPVPSPTALPTGTASPTMVPSPTLLPTLTPIPTSTPAPPSTSTPQPTKTATSALPTGTATATAIPTDTATATNTVIPTDTATATDTATPTHTPTATHTPTNTPTPVPPVVSFDRNDYSINEANGTVTVVVKLDKPAFAPVSVNYSTADDTAFGTADYVPTSGTLAFAVGESSKTFGVIVLDDNVDDPDSERVKLALSGVTGATIGVGSSAVIIRDDDPEPVLSFDSAAYGVSEDGMPIFKVVLDRPSGKDINFLYGPNGNGTATSGLDYLPAYNAYTLSPDVSGVGPTFVYVTWPGLIDDTIPERPRIETIEIELGSLINTSAGSPIITTLSISDND